MNNNGRFQRMYAIPEDEYQHLKSLQQTRDPMEKKFIDLSSEYQQQDTINDPTVRVQRQGETLHAMMNIKDDLKDRLIAATPKLYRSRASSLFQFIGNKIGVNDKGELLDVNNKGIEGSNIGDLIQHAVRDRRRNMVPQGWTTFLQMLRDNNVPQMILNYDTLEEMKPSKAIVKSAPVIKSSRLQNIALKQRPHIKKETLSPSKARKSIRKRQPPDYFLTKTAGVKHAKYI